AAYARVFRRGVLLVLLGMAYNGLLELDFAGMRWVGVLQRIGICYVIASLLYMNLSIRGQAIVTAGLLVGYWLGMTNVAAPAYVAGDLTKEGNLAGYVDRLLMPGRFCCYKLGDNEGILSTFPAVATAMLGVFAGQWLRVNRPSVRSIFGLAFAGLACLAA